jgi:hypothetical protein
MIALPEVKSTSRALRHKFTVSLFVDTLKIEMAEHRCAVSAGVRRPMLPSIRSKTIPSSGEDGDTDHRQIPGERKVRVIGTAYDLADG